VWSYTSIPNTSSWRGAELSTGTTLHFTFTYASSWISTYLSIGTILCLLMVNT